MIDLDKNKTLFRMFETSKFRLVFFGFDLCLYSSLPSQHLKGFPFKNPPYYFILVCYKSGSNLGFGSNKSCEIKNWIAHFSDQKTTFSQEMRL